jgi:hypothetical protein
MNFNINVGQLIQDANTTAVNAVVVLMVVLIASHYVVRAVERIEKKALNGNWKPKENKVRHYKCLFE